MPKVLVLPDHIASQIAAGEVVERPASVVKELVENSLDAGAAQVEVSVGSNCRDIRIADNGCGMEPEDAVLAFQRHATSKIRSVDDLWTLTSFGFRGEAVPSIASVSKVTCYTRTKDAPTGNRLEAAEGKVSCTETGCAPGTIMEITDLFYNVPARLNFLKKAATEFAHIQEALQGLAVAHPAVAFNLLKDGTSVLRTSGSGDLAQVMVETGLLGGQESLCNVDFEDSRSGLRVMGKVAKPVHFRGDRKGILSMVNKRPVRCHLTYKALDYAYSDLIPRGRYPLAVVAIEIDPDKVDVNIHPTKKEIKYSNGNDVYMAIQRALVHALREARTNQPRQFESDTDERELVHAAPYINQLASTSLVRENVYPQPVRIERESAHQISFSDQLVYAPPPRPERSVETFAGSIQSNEDTEEERAVLRLPADWRIAGYIANTYILIENSDGLLIVEQHIAHERTLYERLLARQSTAGRLCDYSQRLIVSAPLHLSTAQLSYLRQHTDGLKKLGFEFEFEGETAVCSEVPLELAGKDYATVVQEMLEQCATADGANLELEATKSVACQSAIKNGMPLGEPDIIKLLGEWLATERNDTCPHGRPISLQFTHEKLFQLFHPV